MSDDAKRFEIPTTDLACNQFFKDRDRDTLEAFQRVMVARTSSHPMAYAERSVDWTEFEQELSRFCDAARIRHMAKHMAERELLYATPMVVIRKPDESLEILEGKGSISAELLASLIRGDD